VNVITCPICERSASGGHHVGDTTVIVCSSCGEYRLAGTAFALLENGTLEKPDPAWFKDLVARRRAGSPDYPIITSYDLETHDG
jgi:hypothetical protein